jgi:hypothetical protein
MLFLSDAKAPPEVVPPGGALGFFYSVTNIVR